MILNEIYWIKSKPDYSIMKVCAQSIKIY